MKISEILASSNKQDTTPIKPVKISELNKTPQTEVVGSKPMLSTDAGVAPMTWTPPSTLNDPSKKDTLTKPIKISDIPKKEGYAGFVDLLSRTQAGFRGVAREVVEKGQDFSKTFEPIKRFNKALANEEYITASQVFKEIPDSESQSVVKNMALNLPKEAMEVSLDFLTDPTTYILGALKYPIKGVGAISKATGLTGKLAQQTDRFFQTPAGKKALEWFVYRGGQDKAYQKLAEDRISNISKGRQLAEETGTMLSKDLSKAEQQRVGQILKGGISVSESQKPLAQKALQARETLTSVGKGAVEQNLLSEETFIANMKTYSPKLYRKWEDSGKKAFDFFGVKPVKIGGQRFLKRTEIPAEVKAEMGEILEPAYPVAKGIAQVTHDVETAKLFNNVAKNSEWTKTVQEAELNPLIKETHVQLPVNKKLGDLSGKYVTKPIADDINEINRMPGTVEKIYNKYLSGWKFSKTVANPASHMRNIMSNTILLDLGGVSHPEQLRLIPKSIGELSSKGKYYQEAKSVDLLGNEFYGGEIKKFKDTWAQAPENIWEKMMSVASKIGDTAGKIYQGEEQVFKLAKFIHSREAGKSIAEAAKEAEKYLFNYEKISKAVQYARKSPVGSPFITFTSKALPVIAETAIKDPLRVGKYALMMKAIENQSKEKLGLTDEDINTIKRTRRGISMVLPFTDKAGDYQTLDVSYILPWGDIGEQGGMFGLPASLSPSNPLPKAIMELGLNKSMFTGRQIFLKTDTASEKASKIADYMTKNVVPLPSWAPGGYSWSKLLDSIAQRPDYMGRVRGLPKVLSDIVGGVKISPVNLGEIAQIEDLNRDKDMAEINIDLQKTLKHPGISAKEKEKKSKIYGEKIKRIYSDKLEMRELFRILMSGGGGQ